LRRLASPGKNRTTRGHPAQCHCGGALRPDWQARLTV
jgi:hypothetical protein